MSGTTAISVYGRLRWQAAMLVTGLVALLPGCDGPSHGRRLLDQLQTALTDGAPAVVLSSNTKTLESYEVAGRTIATAYRTTGVPGDTIRLVSYVYDSLNQTPVDTGVVEFSAELAIDDSATGIEIPIGQAQLVAGRAELDWETPTDYFGDYTVRAESPTGGGRSPGRWEFPLHIAKPDDRGAMHYAMARLNHIVNLMASPTDVASELVDGVSRPLSDLLLEEFNLNLVSSYYRLENNSSHVSFLDVETFMRSLGVQQRKRFWLCVRTTMLVAVNDDVLVIALKGTDGWPNVAVNDAGSPSEYEPYVDGVAVHPGWAWMSAKLADGFPNGICNPDEELALINPVPYPNDSFPGLRQIIETYRVNADGVPRQVYITGHSLGGALARMLAVRLSGTTLMRGDRVYTFGAPWQDAYNDVFDLERFRSYAQRQSSIAGITVTTTEGGQDPIPGLPERTVRTAWEEAATVNGDILTSEFWKSLGTTIVVGAVGGISIKCAVDEIASWFGAGDGCEDDVINRPIGYERPSALWFLSLSHRRLYLDGTPAIRRCYKPMNGNMAQVCEFPVKETACLDTDDLCEPLYHTTDVGNFTELQSRAHWVGDYEFDARRRLRGDPTRYNYYFPENLSGSIRKPIDIIALP